MKIIHLVLGKANPERMNGVNKVAHNLCTSMTELGYDTELWGIANTLDHNYPKRNYSTKLFQQEKNKLSLNTDLITAINGLKRETIVHIHGAFISEFYHIAKRLHQKNVAFFYTPHGALTENAMRKSSWKKKVYFNLFESWIIKKAKRVQLLGQSEVDHLESILPTTNKCVIPNGQIIPDKNLWKTKTERIKKELNFGFCGRLDIYHKGLDNLIDGFRLYLDQGHTGKLVLIGDGKDRVELEKKVIDHKLERHTIFHGAKFGTEKYMILEEMDMFMHPSRMEGFPTAVLEAASLGKPCITSDATNINPYIKNWNAGITIEKSSAESVARAMVDASNLYDNNQLESLGDNAFEMVKNEFTWNKIVGKLIKEYEA